MVRHGEQRFAYVMTTIDYDYLIGGAAAGRRVGGSECSACIALRRSDRTLFVAKRRVERTVIQKNLE